MAICCPFSAYPTKLVFAVATCHQITSFSFLNSCSTHRTEWNVLWQSFSHCIFTSAFVPILFALETDARIANRAFHLRFIHVSASHFPFATWLRTPSHQSVTFLNSFLSEPFQFFDNFRFIFEYFWKFIVWDFLSTFMLHTIDFAYFSVLDVHSELFLTAFNAETMFAYCKFKCDLISYFRWSRLNHICVANWTVCWIFLLIIVNGIFYLTCCQSLACS